MSRRVLVACVGNVFFGDDAFGVEVARRLALEPLPAGAKVVDYGIRGVHLAFELLEPLDLLVLVDATARNGTPGTLYVIDPAEDVGTATTYDAHSLDPFAVLATVRHMGGAIPRTRIVGCEPADVEQGMSLSDPVRRAIEPAAALVRRLIEEEIREIGEEVQP